jgi:hypothetical protein
MRKLQILALVGGFVLIGAATAGAHGTPCCAAKPCPSDRPNAVPGESPAEAECCDEEGTDCVSVANAGWRCTAFQDDPEAAVTGTLDRGAVAGCIDGEMDTCTGGTIDGVPAGCIGLGGFFYVTSSDQMGGGDAAECTRDAVDACCALGACVVDDH